MSTTATTAIEAARRFFDHLFGHEEIENQFVGIWTLPEKQSEWFEPGDAAAGHVTNRSADSDVYYHVCTFRHPTPSNERGKADQAAAMVALWGDIDIYAPKVHDDEELPRTKEDALTLSHRVGLAPSVVIDTGYGLQVLWLLKEPWVFGSDEDRNKAKTLSHRVAEALKARAREMGFRYDTSTHDLARVLRVPGTFNRKNGQAVPVQIVEENSARYEPDDFGPYLVEAQPELPTETTTIGKFKLDASAKVDRTLLSQTCENAPTFRQTWEHRRTDKPGWSLSEYDLSLVGRADTAGWPEQQIANLVIEFRRTHGTTDEDRRKALRPDYIKGTIAKARAGGEAGGKPGTAPQTRSYMRTDLGNSERLIARHGRDLRYCYPWRAWLVWDGKRWTVDDTAGVTRMAKATVRNIYNEASKAAAPDDRKALAAWAAASEAERRIAAMISLARSEVPVVPDDLDADSWLLNVENGTIDLRTGELRGHRRGDLCTKLAPVSYDPKAEAPRFVKFLGEILDWNDELIGFVQRWLGGCLSGDVSEQILLVFCGEGSNGKNTLLDAIKRVLGDYASDAAPDLLTVRRNEEHPTEIADLHGRRLVVASETEEGRQLRVQLVKRLVGDATLKGRRMRQDYFEFKRTHKTILVTNNKPVIRENSHAIWRRVKLVPFTVVIPDERQDKKLPEKLWAERSGILAWMVRGCLNWQQDGLGIPEDVQEATADYRTEQDVIGPFLEDKCTINDGYRVTRAAIWKVYQDWARDTRDRWPLNRTGLYERLALRGFGETAYREHGKVVRGFTGVGLAATEVSGE